MRSSKISLKSKIFVFFGILYLVYYSSFNLVKIPWILDYWFSRNSILGDFKNNKKQRNYLTLFGYIFTLMFASSDSFCLIASHILKTINEICASKEIKGQWPTRMPTMLCVLLCILSICHSDWLMDAYSFFEILASTYWPGPFTAE